MVDLIALSSRRLVPGYAGPLLTTERITGNQAEQSFSGEQVTLAEVLNGIGLGTHAWARFHNQGTEPDGVEGSARPFHMGINGKWPGIAFTHDNWSGEESGGDHHRELWFPGVGRIDDGPGCTLLVALIHARIVSQQLIASYRLGARHWRVKLSTADFTNEIAWSPVEHQRVGISWASPGLGIQCYGVVVDMAENTTRVVLNGVEVSSGEALSTAGTPVGEGLYVGGLPGASKGGEYVIAELRYSLEPSPWPEVLEATAEMYAWATGTSG